MTSFSDPTNEPPIRSGSAIELSRWLHDREVTTPFTLDFTRNRSTLASIRELPDGTFSIRLHYAYGTAPASVLLALARYIDHRKKSDWNIIRDYADGISAPQAPAGDVKPRSVGKQYDLASILDEVNALHFNGEQNCAITWGRHGTRKRRRRRSIRYGSYDRQRKLITIHPALDSPRVPEEFVRYIVFHELLHDAIPSERINGRVLHHPPAYRKREKQYPDYEQMKHLSAALMQKL